MGFKHMLMCTSECVFKGIADFAYRFIVSKFDELLSSTRKKTLFFDYSFRWIGGQCVHMEKVWPSQQVLRSVDPVRRRLVHM